MTAPLVTSLPLSGTLLFYALVFVFWWPAWRWTRPLPVEDGIDKAARAAMAFVLAFGVFAAVSGPLLLAHASTDTAILVLLPTWFLLLVAGEWQHHRQKTVLAPSASEPAAAAPTNPPLAWVLPASPSHLLPPILAALVATMAYASGRLSPRPTFVILGLSFCAAAFLAWRNRLRARSCLMQPPPVWQRSMGGLFLLLLLVALITPALHFRADADDNLYLSEALLLQDSPAMGRFAPTHRGEELPSNPIYAWQSFELWGALGARFSGLHPLIVLRSLMGPLLLGLSLALYAGLLKRFLPRAWLPTAMVLLLAYFLVGMSSQWTPNNYLLPRPQQGKTWLMHLGIAALLLQSLRFLDRPRSAWLPLFLISFACLGWAPTAVLLVPALLGTLAFAAILVRPETTTLHRAVPLLLGILPQVLFAAYLSTRQGDILREDTIGWMEGGRWSDLFFFQFLQMGSLGGGLELVLLSLSPLLLLALPQQRRQAFPLAFSLAAFLVILNPLFYQPTVAFLSGEAGYVRFFWLLPLPLLLASLGSYLVHIALRGRRPLAGGGLTLALILAAYPLCGGNYVWSEDNLYDPPENGIYLHRVDNPYKMPGGLLDVAVALKELPLGPEHRILCHTNVVMHLAPLIEEFDFVYARDFQTSPPLKVLGRHEEASRREALAFDFLGNGMTDADAAPLLAAESAAYLVLDPLSDDLRDQVARLGYRLRLDSDGFSLWVSE